MPEQINHNKSLPKKIDYAAIQRELDKRRAANCKAKLSTFVREFWDTIIEDELVWSPHLDILCDEIQAVYERVFARQPKLYDLIINIPPGTTKSTICTVMAPAWSWTRDPSLRHITGSYSEGLAIEHSVKSRDIIRSGKYRRYFPNVVIKSDEDKKENYKTVRGGQRLAVGIDGTITGIHAHIQTIDDPINPKQAVSVADLSNANRFFDQTLPTRKVDKSLTPLILIMQRLAGNDPTAHLLEKKKKGIRKVCLPATISPEVSPVEYRSIYKGGFLDPVRLGPDVLAEMRIDLGSYSYAGQFDQTPAPPGGLIWQKWFNEVPDDLFPSIDKAQDLGADWDLAYTKDDENAASAYILSGKIGPRTYIWDFDWRWLEFPELIKWMKSIKVPHYIEAKASGKSAKQTLSSMGVIAIEIPVKGGSDKIARARMATPMAEAGMVYIKKSMADRLYNDSKQGILFFPKAPFKDLADTLAQALQRHRRSGKIHVADTTVREDDTEKENPLDWI